MNSSKLNKDVCRICLKGNLKLNWNDEILEFCGISYKDCYYKYTNLEQFDSECYPTSLCEICANGLKNAHMLFEKALESFNILQDVITTKQLETKFSDMANCSSLPTMEHEIQTFEDVMDVKALMHREDEMCLPPLCDRQTKVGTENTINSINYSDKISVTECTTVEPRHFINIPNFESFVETTLEKRLSRKIVSRRKEGILLKPLLDESYNDKISRPSISRRVPRKRRNCDSSPKSSATKNSANETDSKTVSEQNPNESEDDNSILPAIKPKKLRKKHFMCAYCSLTADSASKIEIHEATHNENRKRTETCPKCGIKLFTKLSLTVHMKTHDENRQKNHKCEFCDKAFFNKGGLNIHRRIHLGLMVKCHICPKEYYRQVDLDKHLLSHSETPMKKNVGKKKYAIQCQYCNKSVVTVKWKAHLAAHLGQPQVKCKICEKNFFCRTNCSDHLRRFHHKSSKEYEDFIHYYDQKTRVSLLMMKQQLSAQPLVEN